MFTDFYKAWWFLYAHKMFEDEYGCSRFEHCIHMYIAKVNPLTDAIDKNRKLNTKTEVWLECGKYDKTFYWHDLDLDCGGDTFEEAIINLANRVEISDYKKLKEEKKKLFNETLQLKRIIYNKYPVGGIAHCILDDGNIKNCDIEFCLKEAEQFTEDKALFVKCCENLLKMTPTQRKKLIHIH